jgi:hypothetical protein
MGKCSCSISITPLLIKYLYQVVQERFLSTKVVHFARTTLFWQCLESWSSESFPLGVPEHYSWGFKQEEALKSAVRSYQESRLSVGLRKHRDLVEFPSSDSLLPEIRNEWRWFIGFYSERELTQESDILVALHGISQHIVVDTLLDGTIAGLLESELLRELCWVSQGPDFTTKHPGKPHRPLQWRAPTWSWASTRCPIRYLVPSVNQERLQRQQTAIVISCHAPTRPSGELIEASLRIEGRPFLVSIRKIGWQAHLLNPNNEEFDREMMVYMDDPCFGGEHGTTCLVYLMVLWYEMSGKQRLEGMGALVLSPCGASNECFRRIGYATPRFIASALTIPQVYMVEKILSIHKRADSRVIEIV